jgi:hypothetical protein
MAIKQEARNKVEGIQETEEQEELHQQEGTEERWELEEDTSQERRSSWKEGQGTYLALVQTPHGMG